MTNREPGQEHSSPPEGRALSSFWSLVIGHSFAMMGGAFSHRSFIRLAPMASGMQIGKFQVVGTLGTGAHSTILHVRRSEDSKNYALKVVPIDGGEDHKYLEQAQHEFRVARMLDHPNLVKVHALELVKDWLFRTRKVHLLIEYVNGKTLDT